MKSAFNLNKGTCYLLKAIAAIIVLVHHYALYRFDNGYTSNFILKLFASQGGFLGVGLFFFLSGFGLMESETNNHLTFGTYLKKRMLKVYLPVFLITLLWLPVYYKIYNVDLQLWGGMALIFNDLFIDMKDCVLWFIKVLLLLYFIFYLFVAVYNKNKKLGFTILFISTVFAYTLVSSLKAPSYAVSVPFFAIGVIVSILKSRPRIFISAVSGICFISCTLTCLHQYFGASFMLPHTLFNYFALFTLILVFSKYSIDIKCPALIGALSFDVYLIHYKVIYTLTPNKEDINIALFISLTLIAITVFYPLRTFIAKKCKI